MKTTTLKIFLTTATILFLGVGCSTPISSIQSTEPTSTQQVSVTGTIVGTAQKEKVGYTITDRVYWYKQLNWPVSCEQSYQTNAGDSAVGGGLAFYRIDSNTNLVRVTCDQFAYQESMIFMLTGLDNNGTVISTKLLKLPIYSYKEKKVIPTMLPEVLGTDSFDTTNNTLRIFEKARGVGDCGTLDIYSVSTSSIELQEEHALDCDTNFYEKNHITPENYKGPQSWPLIYQKK